MNPKDRKPSLPFIDGFGDTAQAFITLLKKFREEHGGENPPEGRRESMWVQAVAKTESLKPPQEPQS